MTKTENLEEIEEFMRKQMPHMEFFLGLYHFFGVVCS